MDTAAELEAIKRLKYAYFRTLDLKEFDALGLLLTEDATASYEDGKTVLEGRTAIVPWLSAALGGPRHRDRAPRPPPRDRLHLGHRGRGHLVPAGPGHCAGGRPGDRRHRLLRRPLRLTDDGWRISHTGYMRVFEEHRTHSTLEVRTFSSRFSPA